MSSKQIQVLSDIKKPAPAVNPGAGSLANFGRNTQSF
jgi:hypothetical protein